MPDFASPRMIERARTLRRDMTGPERRLWAKLRAHRMLGVHFRRQAPLGKYVTDFLCLSAKLVIEIDGDQHGQPENMTKDRDRDLWLAGQGYRVLRFSNWQVMNEFETVLLTIEHIVSHHAPSQPSPEGEG